MRARMSMSWVSAGLNGLKASIRIGQTKRTFLICVQDVVICISKGEVVGYRRRLLVVSI